MTEFIINNFMTDIFAWMPRNDVNDTYKNAYKFLRMRHSLVSIMKTTIMPYVISWVCTSPKSEPPFYMRYEYSHPIFIVFTYQEIFERII
jgi:hypothetical protein